MRRDGRRADALRPVKLALGYTRYAEGSVLITQGNTVSFSLIIGTMPCSSSAASMSRALRIRL